MNRERMERAQFAADLRRKGTLLSDEAIGDVCEALLELLETGGISLELHEEITAELRAQRDAARMDLLRLLAAPKPGPVTQPRPMPTKIPGPGITLAEKHTSRCLTSGLPCSCRELDEVIRSGGRD